MKLFNIFIKNLKTISRNWIYFAVLFLMPLILITASSIMLNSNKLENVRIGLIGEFQDVLPQGSGIGKEIQYISIQECLYRMSNAEVSVCISVAEDKSQSKRIDVYVDNTRRVVDLYIKQAILEKMFSQQNQEIQFTSDVLDSKLVLYSNSISESRLELDNAERDLDEQEQQLIQYRNDLAVQRQEFDSKYWQIKAMQPQIRSVRNQVATNQDQITQNVNFIRSQVSVIRNSIVSAQNILAPVIFLAEYSQANTNLNNALNAANNIDNSLNAIQSSYPSNEVIRILDEVDAMIYELDQVKSQLDKIDQELLEAIDRTRETKNKIAVLRTKLNNAETEILDLRNLRSDSGASINFIDAFSVQGDLVLVAFPFVISIIITFTSLVLANRFTLAQINRPSYLREIISPTKDVTFVLADYFINIFFIFIQTGVLFAIGFFRFGMTLEQLPLFFISIFLTSSILIFIGISIGYLVKSESLSVLMTIFLVMFLFIFSDVLVPSILSGVLVRFLVNLSPFVLLNNILVGIIILNKNYFSLVSSLFKLCIMLASSFLIAYLSKKASKENVIQ